MYERLPMLRQSLLFCSDNIICFSNKFDLYLCLTIVLVFLKKNYGL